ncbi:MAG: hypothetical protein V2A61_03950, partial [Calditrichota bacterium]
MKIAVSNSRVGRASSPTGRTKRVCPIILKTTYDEPLLVIPAKAGMTAIGIFYTKFGITGQTLKVRPP